MNLPGAPRDERYTVVVRNLVVMAGIGIRRAEHGRQQRVRVSVELTATREAGFSADDRRRVINYEKIVAAIREIASEEDKLRLQLQTARLNANAAERIRFENIDKDNFLLILAPVAGVITDVSSTQPGDKIQANTPLGGIAPKDARAVVRMEIAERDRAFLREGLPVKLKFTAFPYQRYGFIDGTLVFISPATQPGAATKEPVYEGHVTLDRDHYVVAETKYPVRYGMTATAEIVVRERRLIDLALDPFREIAG